MDSIQKDKAAEKPDAEIKLKGGILIVGSLWWDPEREDWRNMHLNTKAKIYVPAPIRYGKISNSRNCTYTMVFSTEYDVEGKRGQAMFVPFGNNPLDWASLHTQSVALIKAERNKNTIDSTHYYWDWGTLGICFNPKVEKKDQDILLVNWTKRFTGFESQEYKSGKETSVMNKDGCLLFVWPEALNEYDFLVATAIKPVQPVYADVKKIVERMVVNEYTEYFDKNRAALITTIDDDNIIKELKGQK